MSAESQSGEKHPTTEQALSVWSELGLPEPPPAIAGHAPPVEWTLLRRLARDELPDHAARMAYRLVFAYAEWKEAFAQILAEEPPNGGSATPT